MKNIKIVILLSTLAMVACDEKMKEDKITYPETLKGNVVDNYFGKDIADPYRWLEDDRSEETKNWVIVENKVTNNYLSKIPFRDKIYNRLQKLWNYEKSSTPEVHGNFTYFYKNDGLQSQDVIYRKNSKGNEEVFLNPNTLFEN